MPWHPNRFDSARSYVSTSALVRCVVIGGLASSLGACVRFGPQRLDEDQFGSSRALVTSEKRETLLNAVRLRYADTPSFLQGNQEIFGHQLPRNLTAGLTAFPSTSTGNTVFGSGSVQLQQRLTFTFQPIAGEQFAESFLRPLSPTKLLSLSLSGMPIDVLFRVKIQSVNSWQNARHLEHIDTVGNPQFFLLLRDLRLLQEAGLLGVKIQPAGANDDAKGVSDKSSKVAGRAYLLIGDPTENAAYADVLDETRKLPGLSAGSYEAEFVYRRSEPGNHQIGVPTRSMLGVPGELASQIEAPEADVKGGKTIHSAGQIGVEHKPVA